MFLSRRKARLVVTAGLLGLVCLGFYAGSSPGLRAETHATRDSLREPGLSARNFRADITVRHQRISAAGALLLPVPADLTMRVERVDRGGRWLTSLVMNQPANAVADRAGVRTGLSNPFFVARVEFEDGDEEPKLYDRAGNRVRPVTDADRLVFGAAQAVRVTPGVPGRSRPLRAVGGLLVEAVDRDVRRSELQQRFGPPVGRVRGLDRFVSTSGEGSQEVLVTSDTVLPVEVNVSMPGGISTRMTMSYDAYGSRGHVRRLTRSEQTFDASAARSVTEVELTNVVIAGEVTP